MSRISIHAPREGGDDLWIYDGTGYSQFQSTPPARGATLPAPCQDHGQPFQSTPPARGATARWVVQQHSAIYFNPRPPRGGRRQAERITNYAVGISIHAPREGGDCWDRRISSAMKHFNPRPPRGGRHSTAQKQNAHGQFQSTPPREGGRLCLSQSCPADTGVSIHAPPRGGRP